MTVHYETDGAVVIVTIDRPEVANAVDRVTAEELVEAFERFDGDDGLSVAILTGAGGKFCAGGDLKAMIEGSGITVADRGRWASRADADDAVEAGDSRRRRKCCGRRA